MYNNMAQNVRITIGVSYVNSLTKVLPHKSIFYVNNKNLHCKRFIYAKHNVNIRRFHDPFSRHNFMLFKPLFSILKCYIFLEGKGFNPFSLPPLDPQTIPLLLPRRYFIECKYLVH